MIVCIVPMSTKKYKYQCKILALSKLRNNCLTLIHLYRLPIDTRLGDLSVAVHVNLVKHTAQLDGAQVNPVHTFICIHMNNIYSLTAKYAFIHTSKIENMKHTNEFSSIV